MSRNLWNMAYAAMTFATTKHADQKRKYTGVPYITHCAEVAGIVACVNDTAVHCRDACIAAAWLHDVVEDCGVEFDEIEQLFGTDVRTLVSGLTDVSRPENGNRAARKALDRAHTAQSGHDVATIKCADLISNTRSIVRHDPAFARVYLAEKRLLLDCIGGDERVHALAEAVWQDGMAELAEWDRRQRFFRSLWAYQMPPSDFVLPPDDELVNGVGFADWFRATVQTDPDNWYVERWRAGDAPKEYVTL